MKRYNISFLSDYLKLKKIPFYIFSNELELCDASFRTKLIGSETLSEEKLNILLKIFNVNSYDELKSLAENDKTSSIDNINLDIYDISFLEPYLGLKKIHPKDISKLLDISDNMFSKNLRGTSQNFSGKNLEKLLKIFNVNTYEELKELVKTDKTSSIDNINLDFNYYNLSFLKDYFISNNILQTEISKELNISTEEISLILNGKLIKKDTLDNFLKKFNCSTYEELKEKFIDGYVAKEIDKPKEYDVSFFKEYIAENIIPINKLSKVMNIPKSTIYRILKDPIIDENTLNQILEFYNFNSYEELKEKIYERYIPEDNSEEKEKTYDASFFKEYVLNNKLSVINLSKIMNISRSTIFRILKDPIINENTLNQILKFYNFNSYEELKENFDKKISLTEIEELKQYDISFLKDYLKLKGISHKNFSTALDVSESFVYTKLNGSLISSEYINLILDLFNVESYEELKKLVAEDKSTSIDNFNDKLKFYDVTFLKEFFLLYDFDYELREAIANELNIDISLLDNFINSKINIKDLKKICDFFYVNTYDELKEKIITETKLLKGKYDISFLKEYIALKNISCEMLSRKIQVSPNAFENCLNGNDKIVGSKLRILLKVFNVKTYEELKKIVITDKTSFVDNINSDKKGKYDVSFLKNYFSNDEIIKQSFLNEINLSHNRLDDILSGKKLMTDTELEKTFIYFNVKSLNELIEYIKIEELIRREKIINNNVLINNLKKIYKKNNIPDKIFEKAISFSELDDIDDENLFKILKQYPNKNDRIHRYIEYYILLDESNKKYIEELIKNKCYNYIFSYEVNVDTINKNIELIINDLINNYDTTYTLAKNIKIIVQKNLNILSNVNNSSITTKIESVEIDNSLYDIRFLNKILRENNINLNELSKLTNLPIEELYNYIKLGKKISKNKLNKILDIFHISSYDELKSNAYNLVPKLKRKLLEDKILSNNKIDNEILLNELSNYSVSEKCYEAIAMIFNKEKQYSVGEIGKITNLSNKEILNIYSDCLKIYRSKIEKKYTFSLEYINNI